MLRILVSIQRRNRKEKSDIFEFEFRKVGRLSSEDLQTTASREGSEMNTHIISLGNNYSSSLLSSSSDESVFLGSGLIAR